MRPHLCPLGRRALYGDAHVLEGYVLTPLLVRTTVRFPPAYTLAAQAVLGTIYGVAGLTFATPILIVGTVLVKKLYIDRREAREARADTLRASRKAEGPRMRTHFATSTSRPEASRS